MQKFAQKMQKIIQKFHLADIALVVLVHPALLIVPILKHTATYPDTRYCIPLNLISMKPTLISA